MKLSVIIPVYNEVKTINEIIKKVLEVNVKYKEIILFLARKNKIEAFKLWRKLPLGNLKVRAFLGLITPSKYFFLLRK